MSPMDYYLGSNAIRELVLSLCKLSNHIFEISLNSSLVTDELSGSKNHLKSYAIYSDKMNVISGSLGEYVKSMLRQSTRVMEISLEKTTYSARIEKLKKAQTLVSDPNNLLTLKKATILLEKRLVPLDVDASDTLGVLDEDFKKFSLEIKKLWLLATNLKAHIEFDEITYLSNIYSKIETALVAVDETINKLYTQLSKMERYL